MIAPAPGPAASGGDATASSAVVLVRDLAIETGLSASRIAQVASAGQLVGTLQSHRRTNGVALRRWEFERRHVDDWLADREAREMCHGFEPAALRHLCYLRLRDLRHATIYNRARILRGLRQWAGGPLLGLDEASLFRWQDERARQVGALTRRTEVSNVRAFYEWAVVEELIERNPARRLITPRTRCGARCCAHYQTP